MRKKKNNKGFSLIELIIAIAILLVLTGLLAPQFMKYIEKSREAKDIQTLDSVYTAVQGAIADEAAYKELGKTYLSEDGKGIEDGEELSTVLEANDNFGKEVRAILGKDDVGLTSKDAAAVTGGKVYISVNDDMQVGVWFGTQTTPVEKFTVGTIPETTP